MSTGAELAKDPIYDMNQHADIFAELGVFRSLSSLRGFLDNHALPAPPPTSPGADADNVGEACDGRGVWSCVGRDRRELYPDGVCIVRILCLGSGLWMDFVGVWLFISIGVGVKSLGMAVVLKKNESVQFHVRTINRSERQERSGSGAHDGTE